MPFHFHIMFCIYDNNMKLEICQVPAVNNLHTNTGMDTSTLSCAALMNKCKNYLSIQLLKTCH